MKKILLAFVIFLVPIVGHADMGNIKSRCMLIAVKNVVPNIDGVKLQKIQAKINNQLSHPDALVFDVNLEINILGNITKTSRVCLWLKRNNSVRLLRG